MTDLMKSLGNKPRRGRVRKCPACDKEFYRKPSDMSGKYCSRACKAAATTKKIGRKCHACGKEFRVAPSMIKHRGAFFCSKKCLGKERAKHVAAGPKSRSGRKIHITALDNLFSRYIRGRDKWTCQRCGTIHELGSMGLHCSHFIGRANKSTRFDEANCMSLCWGCHQFMDTHKATLYRRVMLDRLGQDGYDALEARSNIIVKRSEADLAELRSKYLGLTEEQREVK